MKHFSNASHGNIKFTREAALNLSIPLGFTIFMSPIILRNSRYQDVIWNYLPVPKHQRTSRWSLGWISNSISQLIDYMISYACWDYSQSMLVKGPLEKNTFHIRVPPELNHGECLAIINGWGDLLVYLQIANPLRSLLISIPLTMRTIWNDTSHSMCKLVLSIYF